VGFLRLWIEVIYSNIHHCVAINSQREDKNPTVDKLIH